MKKFLCTLALIFTLVTSSFASDIKVSGKVLAAFEQAFNHAKNVKWAQVKDMYQARFSQNNQSYAAYFTAAGEMVVVARFITPDALPKGLQASLKQSAGNKKIAHVFELSDEDGIHYYATLQNGDEKEMLQSSGTKKWIAYDKLKL